MAKPERAAVGGDNEPAARSGWQSAFLWALIAVALSTVLFLFVLAGACDGSSDAATPASSSPASGTTNQATATTPPSATKTPGTAPSATQTGDGSADTTPLLKCGDILAPLDKQHRLAADCAPGDLVQLSGSISAEGSQFLRGETASAITELFSAARKDGFALLVNSSYRSFANQVDTYNYWVQTSGREYADRTSARAGHSEHQLGTTADVGTDGHFLEDFNGTLAAAWLAANSWKFGFIVSYPDGKEAITGYAPEAWHIRYVGKDVASRVHASGLTLHEFLLR